MFFSRFFKISPREAELMDPNHRLFLMKAYEALEMAGYSDGSERSRSTDPRRIGTFFGQCNDDWRIASHDMKGCDAYTLQSTQRAFGPGRLAFQMKWEGPTYSLDSACSSSSSAIHLASMSLLSGDIDLAVTGAANIVCYPHSQCSLSKSGVLSNTVSPCFFSFIPASHCLSVQVSSIGKRLTRTFFRETASRTETMRMGTAEQTSWEP